jgi:hypothetical protein
MKNKLVVLFFTGLLVGQIGAALEGKGGKASPVAADSKPEAATTMDVWVSDEKCGANVNAECAKKCQEQGVKLVVVNAADRVVIPVANQDSIKPFIGQHVTVTGTMNKGSLTIASVKPKKDKMQ